jgi:hypothetical protein
MTFRRNEASVNPFSIAVRSSSLHRAGGLIAFALALPLTLVACAGGDDAPGTGGTSGAGGATGGAGGSGGTAGASGGTAGASGGTGGAASGAGGAASGAGGSAGASAPLYGNFTFEVVEETPETDPFTRFQGAVFDGQYPPPFPLTLDSTDGDCELWVPTNASCPAGCSGGVCTAAGVCSLYPKEVSVGPVTVEGIDPAAFTVSPITTKFVYQATSSLPNPPCTEGSTFGVSGSGFSVQAKCIKPLVLTSTIPIPVMSGSPVALTWEAADEPTARINVKLDIAHHGGRKGEIQCDVADTGSFSIPAALVTKLVNLGLAGFPTIGVKRIVHATSTEEPGLVLVMAAPLERAVDTGIESCNESTDCEDGEVCNDFKICE